MTGQFARFIFWIPVVCFLFAVAVSAGLLLPIERLRIPPPVQFTTTLDLSTEALKQSSRLETSRDSTERAEFSSEAFSNSTKTTTRP